MPRIQAIDPKQATGKAKLLLDAVQKKLGITPNLTRTMAQSPAVLEAYLGFSGALAGGVLDASIRELIALTVAESNACDYCLSAHTAIGKMVGLNPEEIASGREGRSADARSSAILRFARLLVKARGIASDQDLRELRGAGVSEAEITEIVANVGLNIFTNYFNHVAETEIDFPKVSTLATAAV